MNKALFSSACDEWETPPDLFEALNEEFHFTLDACALPETAKCPRYFTPEDDGLSRPWAEIAGGCYFLQSAIFTADEGQARPRGLDQEGRRGGLQARGGGRYATPGPNRYRRLSRVHIPSGGDPLYQGPGAFPHKWKARHRRPIPEYDRYFQRPEIVRGGKSSYDNFTLKGRSDPVQGGRGRLDADRVPLLTP